MKLPWPLYLAWKQLFPSQKKVSFFSLLAVVGVALGVNVMIVVIIFMQGFQNKFRNDIIDAQGHGRVIQWKPSNDWREQQKKIAEHSSIKAVMPYLQGQLLLQKGDYHSIPFSMGIEPAPESLVLDIDSFLTGGAMKLNAHDAEDITPVPTIEALEDDVVFVSTQVANRLGVRPPTIIRFYDQNKSRGADSSTVSVSRLDPFVETGEWEVLFISEEKYLIRDTSTGDEIEYSLKQGPVDRGIGFPIFKPLIRAKPFRKGELFKFHVFKGSTIEAFSPSMIEKVKADEMIPPREVRIGGIFEVPWQGFHTEALFSTIRFMQDMRGDEGRIDGFYLKAIKSVASNEIELAKSCQSLEAFLGDGWEVVPWFIENAWFFDLLKFEEYLMILIMVPIGLVAAFAIAIALMTSVLRKIREIGLLVAMGGARFSVGAVFCLQGFIIGILGAIFGCGFALIFMYFRDELMTFIVKNIAGEDGQAGVSQFYDFYSLEIYYPWESVGSLNTFLSFAFFAVLVSTLAGLLPAWRATRLKPADALRGE